MRPPSDSSNACFTWDSEKVKRNLDHYNLEHTRGCAPIDKKRKRGRKKRGPALGGKEGEVYPGCEKA